MFHLLVALQFTNGRAYRNRYVHAILHAVDDTRMPAHVQKHRDDIPTPESVLRLQKVLEAYGVDMEEFDQYGAYSLEHLALDCQRGKCTLLEDLNRL